MTRDDDKRADILIAEYNAVRGLVAQKATASHALVGAYLTLAALVLGFVVANSADPRLLLMVPILAAVFGITILRRREDQEAARRYVSDVLRPIAAQCSGDDRLLRWDDFYRNHKDARHLLYEFGSQLIFPLSGSAALVAVLPHLSSFVERVAWVVGLALLVLLVSTYVRQNRAYLGARARRLASGTWSSLWRLPGR